MKMIYMGKYNPNLEKIFDGFFETNDEALKYIRHNYKAGNTKFYINTPNDDIIKEIKTLHDSGKMKHIKLNVHNRSGNYDFVKSNKEWMEAYEQ